MILWKFTFREIKSRPGRATLTLLSIVIGVAAVVAVTVGTATTNQAFQEMYANVAGRAALEVVAAGNSGFSEKVVETIEKTPGVKIAVPTFQRGTVLRFGKKRIPMSAMGIDPECDKAVRDYDLVDGRFFEDKRDAVLEASFAKGLGVKVGDQVKLTNSHGKPVSFTISGLLSSRGVAGFKQGGVVFVSLSTAQRVFGKAGEVNIISVVLADDANEKTVNSSLAAVLPKALTVRTPSERSQLSKEMIEKVRMGLDIAYVTIMVLAFVTILNTFLMNVGERRRQLAVLRAIGTTRSQLIKMLLVEGLVMGFVGTLLGTAAGLGGACLLTQSLGKVYSAPMPALRITVAPFIAAGCLGPIVSLLAMFIPAWIAGRISPLEGMRFVASNRRGRIPALYAVAACLTFLTTGSLMAACILGYLPAKLMTIVGVLFTASFLLLIPMILRPLAWLVALVLNPILRTEGRIANRQILRRVVRTSLTVGILYVAVSTAVSLGTTILDTVNDVHSWSDTTFRSDFLVRATSQQATADGSAKMPESFVNDLRAVPGVANVDSLRTLFTNIESPNLDNGKQQVRVIVRDYTDKGKLPLDIKSGDKATLREDLSQGQVVLGTNLAHRLDVKAGDNIKLDTVEGPKQLRVAATASAYWDGGMVVYMEGQTARRLLNADGVDAFIIDAQPGMREQVYEQLKQLKAKCDENDEAANDFLLQTFAELQRTIDEMTTGVIAGLWGLLVLALIVGAFAVANTLTMNVLEQTRELALLRVVAMTRWQVRKSILAQALTIGAIGLLTGTVGGMIGAFVMNLCSAKLMGQPPVFAMHPTLILACIATGFVVIIGAALIPAERASRLKLLIALQYE
jgi:putative ABC transport system permease protein